jgi:putative heme-binding domain-containing protein
MATRYLAWTALQRMEQQAEPALTEMRNSDNPVFQARAMWLLGKLGLANEKTNAVVREALQDKNADLRIAALRLARQLPTHSRVPDLEEAVINDPSPAVRREMLIGMHETKPGGLQAGAQDEAFASLWSQLAQRYDGSDRWYLEALGIAAAGRWDACLSALTRDLGVRGTSSKAGRDIVWRSRGTNTSELIAAAIQDPATPAEVVPRFFRALDFQSESFRQRVLLSLAFGDYPDLPSERVSLIRSESIARLRSSDVSKNERYQKVLEEVLAQCAGSEQFIRIVDKFSMTNHYDDLLVLAQSKPESQLAADALRVLFDKGQAASLDTAISSDDPDLADRTLTALATAADARGDDLLLPLLSDAKRPLAQRRLAVKALGASTSGAEKLLRMARQRNYPDQLHDAVAAALAAAHSPAVREAAAAIFPAPPTKDSTPLPPLSALMEMKGDSERGKIAFNTTATCAKCHQPNPDGKDVGPDLSQIGDKLARQAMFESILFPSAAISHNFETSLIVTDDGSSHTGILVSQTDTELRLKDENGIIRAIPVGSIDSLQKSDVSLMPSDIQKLLSAQELVDVIEYMSTLKTQK